ncbi:hypothetical protein FGO68_gene15765 [Halteria grandinella]|uniref:Uncharacterized protein n=1 Tax=Halteria grandinella TaxID=5974 RepID=A0A8J8T608_HALGN|nr:hypothetical protein FGO68_gene15765 [Halteria grandinella]
MYMYYFLTNLNATASSPPVGPKLPLVIDTWLSSYILIVMTVNSKPFTDIPQSLVFRKRNYRTTASICLERSIPQQRRASMSETAFFQWWMPYSRVLVETFALLQVTLKSTSTVLPLVQLLFRFPTISKEGEGFLAGSQI